MASRLAIYEKQEIQSELLLLSTDNKNNKFFIKNSTREVFKLNDGTDTVIKINGTGSDFISEILFDKENNAYFRTEVVLLLIN